MGEVGGGILGIVSYSDSLAALFICLTTLYASFVTVRTVSGSLYYSTQKFMIPYKYIFQRYNYYYILTHMRVLLRGWIIPMSY